jgi:excisionase family DNA binding protein
LKPGSAQRDRFAEDAVSQQQVAQVPHLLRAADVAIRLGVSKQVVYKLDRDGEIPAVRISERRVRFDPRDVSLFLDRRTSLGRSA